MAEPENENQRKGILIRLALVARARRTIRQGIYDDSEVLQAAIDDIYERVVEDCQAYRLEVGG